MQSFSSFINIIRFNLLYMDKYSFGRTRTYPGSTIPYSMLRYIIGGSAEFVVDGETVTVRKGQVSYIPEGRQLLCKALEDTFVSYSIRFTTSVFYRGADFLREYYNFPLVMDVDKGIELYFDDIHGWVRTDEKSKSFHVRGAPDTLIASLIDTLDSGEPDDVKAEINGLEYNLEQIRKRVKKSTVQTDPKIQTVIDHIMLNPTEEYTSDKLSGMAEVAKTTFQRLFEEATGKIVIESIRQVRLITAARLLLVSNDPVNCVAHDVGLEDVNHFTQIFRWASRMAPGWYRKMSQEQRWGRDGDEEVKQGT